MYEVSNPPPLVLIYSCKQKVDPELKNPMKSTKHIYCLRETQNKSSNNCRGTYTREQLLYACHHKLTVYVIMSTVIKIACNVFDMVLSKQGNVFKLLIDM